MLAAGWQATTRAATAARTVHAHRRPPTLASTAAKVAARAAAQRFASSSLSSDETAAATANQDWTRAALSPLIHKQTGIRVHLVGIHGTGTGSIDAAGCERVRAVLDSVRPAVVCVDLDAEQAADLARHRSVVSHASVSARRSSPAVPSTSGGTVLLYASKRAPRHSPAGSAAETVQYRGFDGRHDAAHVIQQTAMGVAIHKAQQMGSAVKLVGVSASLLAEPHSHSPDLLDIVQEGRNRFRVSRTGSPAEASFVGRLLYRLASYAVFGFSQGQLQRRMERDLMSVHDMATHLRLWGMFHPTLSQQHVELRNAVAMERVRRLVRTLSRWHSAQQPTANYHHSTPASEEPCVAGSDLDRKAIVVVTGKRNVVGMAAMWDEAVKNERFFTGRSATASNWIVTDHGVPDLVHTQQAAMEPADDAVASTAVQYDLPPWVDAVDATQPQTASLADRGGQQANAAAASPPATPEPLLLPTADSAVHPAVTDAAQKPLVEENNDPRPMSATDRARLFKQSKKAFKYVD